MEENNQKFVDFSYCAHCKHKDVKEYLDPCNACLTVPARIDGSVKPVKFEKEEKPKK